jgi:hypothetical protein
MDSRRDYQPEDPEADGPPMPTQAELEAMFDADDADVAAGRVVPVEPVLAEMRATAARIRRERQAEKAMAPPRA